MSPPEVKETLQAIAEIALQLLGASITIVALVPALLSFIRQSSTEVFLKIGQLRAMRAVLVLMCAGLVAAAISCTVCAFGPASPTLWILTLSALTCGASLLLLLIAAIISVVATLRHS